MLNVGGYTSGAGVRVTKLLLHETGSYNTQFRRPYDTHIDHSTLDTFIERVGTAGKYTPGMLGGISGKFLSATATPEKEIGFINGWQERRMRFMMEVEYNYATGGKMREVVLGYTDHSGVTMNGHVDPRMNFYINSIMEVRDSLSYGPAGASNNSSIINNSHILVDNNWKDIYDPNRDQHMRPTDVYTAMTRVHLQDINQHGTVDTRNMSYNAAVKSRRSNAAAGDYMARIFNGYVSAVLKTKIGDSERMIIDEARNTAPEASAVQDPFLSAIMQARGESSIGNTFVFGDLLRIDPNVESVTHAQLLSPQTQATVHHAGQTAEWGGSDLDTSTATILSQTIPALLMDLAMTRIVFKTSNRDFNSAITTVVMDAQGFSDGDLSRPLALFVHRIETEVLQDISFNNGIDFAIEMSVDLLGETWLKLSLQGKPFVDYVTPSFADALLTPVVSSLNSRVLNLAGDFQVMAEHLADHNESTSGSNNFGSSNFSNQYAHI